MGNAVGFGELKKPSPEGGGAANCLWTEYRRKRRGPIVVVIVVVVVVVVLVWARLGSPGLARVHSDFAGLVWTLLRFIWSYSA